MWEFLKDCSSKYWTVCLILRKISLENCEILEGLMKTRVKVILDSWLCNYSYYKNHTIPGWILQMELSLWTPSTIHSVWTHFSPSITYSLLAVQWIAKNLEYFEKPWTCLGFWKLFQAVLTVYLFSWPYYCVEVCLTAPVTSVHQGSTTVKKCSFCCWEITSSTQLMYSGAQKSKTTLKIWDFSLNWFKSGNEQKVSKTKK